MPKITRIASLLLLTSSLFSWLKNRTIVALSTSEAECVNLSTTERKDTLLNALETDHGFELGGAMELLVDNQTSLQMVREA